MQQTLLWSEVLHPDGLQIPDCYYSRVLWFRVSVITDRLRPIRAHAASPHAASPQGRQTGIKAADLRETPIPNHEQKGSMGGPNITLVSLSTGRRSALQERPLPQCAHCCTRLLQLEFGVQPPIQAGFRGNVNGHWITASDRVLEFMHTTARKERGQQDSSTPRGQLGRRSRWSDDPAAPRSRKTLDDL